MILRKSGETSLTRFYPCHSHQTSTYIILMFCLDIVLLSIGNIGNNWLSHSEMSGALATGSLTIILVSTMSY